MENDHSPLHNALHPFEAAEEQFAREFPREAAEEAEKARDTAAEEPLTETSDPEEAAPSSMAESESSVPEVPEENISAPAEPPKSSFITPRRIVIAALLALMLVSGWKLGGMMIDYRKNDKGYSDLAEEVVSTPAPTPTPAPDDPEPEAPPERAPIVVNMAALEERNPDTVAWLYCADTPIDFAIVQTDNNWTYMGWNFNRQQSVFGWTFMDYRCKGDFSGYCHTIYGHNMQNGSVFACLEKYQKQEYYDEHPVMWLITPDVTYKIRLIAGTFFYGTEEAYGGFGDNEEGYRAYLRSAVAESTFDSGIDPETVDRVVMLSTCSNVRPDMRFAVIGTLDPLEE